ncbi:MAG: transglutaminase domain-containing protein, partial [Phycisphaerales bacterium]
PGARRDERTPASFDLPRIREIAAAILEPAGVSPDPATRPIDEDARAARLIQEHLRRNYGYTLLESQTPTGVDPIEHFLLTSREGHCEYFAAAMAALCRSVGINARIVAGYLAAEYNEASGHYIVRESNAHAWVEAEAGMGNWRMYDPTPPADLARLHRPAPGFFTRLRQMFDAAEHAWNRSVVGFDERAREQILAPASGPGQLLAGRLENLSERIRIGGGRLFFSALLRGLVVFAAAAALLFSLSMLAGLLPRRARSRAGARPRWPELRFYEHLLRALRRLGHPKPLWRPPLAHAATLSDEALATPAAAITRLYYRARFGGVMPTQTELAEARAALRRLKRRDRPVR